MKNNDKNFNDKASQPKNQTQQSGQLGKEQKYGKSDVGSVEPKSSRDLNGNVAGRDTSAIDDLDDTDDENVY